MSRNVRFLLSLLPLLLLPGLVFADSTLDRIKSRGVIVVGVRGDAPPFGFVDRGTGKLVGYDADYAAAVAARLKVRLELKAVALESRLGGLISGDLDLLAANLTASESRDKVIDFSNAYLVTGQGLIAKKGAVTNLGGLIGRRIGVVLGTPSETCAKNVCVGSIIVPFTDYGSALASLQKGEIAAFSSDQAILLDLLTFLPKGDFEMAGFLLNKEEYVLGIRQGDTAFAAYLNEAIDELAKNGTADRIKGKWFSPSDDRPPAAFGAVLRKAVGSTRVVAVNLEGVFFPNAEVAFFSPDGGRVAKGTVAAVVGDQVYVDVDQASYSLILSGYLVTLNVSDELAMKLAQSQERTLEAVRVNTVKEDARIEAESAKDFEERVKRRQELDRIKEQNDLQINLERERYRNLLRNSAWWGF